MLRRSAFVPTATTLFMAQRELTTRSAAEILASLHPPAEAEVEHPASTTSSPSSSSSSARDQQQAPRHHKTFGEMFRDFGATLAEFQQVQARSLQQLRALESLQSNKNKLADCLLQTRNGADLPVGVVPPLSLFGSAETNWPLLRDVIDPAGIHVIGPDFVMDAKSNNLLSETLRHLAPRGTTTSSSPPPLPWWWQSPLSAPTASASGPTTAPQDRSVAVAEVRRLAMPRHPLLSSPLVVPRAALPLLEASVVTKFGDNFGVGGATITTTTFPLLHHCRDMTPMIADTSTPRSVKLLRDVGTRFAASSTILRNFAREYEQLVHAAQLFEAGTLSSTELTPSTASAATGDTQNMLPRYIKDLVIGTLSPLRQQHHIVRKFFFTMSPRKKFHDVFVRDAATIKSLKKMMPRVNLSSGKLVEEHPLREISLDVDDHGSSSDHLARLFNHTQEFSFFLEQLEHRRQGEPRTIRPSSVSLAPTQQHQQQQQQETPPELSSEERDKKHLSSILQRRACWELCFTDSLEQKPPYNLPPLPHQVFARPGPSLYEWNPLPLGSTYLFPQYYRQQQQQQSAATATEGKIVKQIIGDGSRSSSSNEDSKKEKPVAWIRRLRRRDDPLLPLMLRCHDRSRLFPGSSSAVLGRDGSSNSSDATSNNSSSSHSHIMAGTKKEVHSSIASHLETAVQERQKFLSKLATTPLEPLAESDPVHAPALTTSWECRKWWPCGSLRKHNKTLRPGAEVVRLWMRKKNNGEECVAVSYANDADVLDAMLE